jgi:hypothetical protein
MQQVVDSIIYSLRMPMEVTETATGCCMVGLRGLGCRQNGEWEVAGLG